MAGLGKLYPLLFGVKTSFDNTFLHLSMRLLTGNQRLNKTLMSIILPGRE